MMNMTTEILRKAVIVTIKNGNNPSIVRRMIKPTVLGASVIAGEAHDSHTQTVSDLHQRAAAQTSAVGHDVERLVERAGQRHQRAGRPAPEVTARKPGAAR